MTDLTKFPEVTVQLWKKAGEGSMTGYALRTSESYRNMAIDGN